jgi:PII-like signaling protein
MMRLTPPSLAHGLPGERTLLRVFVTDADQHSGTPLFETIMNMLRSRGLAGATVLRSIGGFGVRRMLHTEVNELASLELPVVVECVDHEARIQSVLPALDAILTTGLVTLERAEVIVYRNAESGPETEKP